MHLLKKIDRFVLKSFFALFAASFFCCLFVFMMQFTWRSIDDLIGKGLTMDLLAEFFWYMGLALMPQALPLSILLAALMTFGNMGQRLELLSMKAAGISLLRIMRPVAIFSVLLGCLSMYFQNETSPKAQLKLNTLLLSVKMNSPVLEIPEGTFYNGVPNINLYVARKNNETGMLYNMIIYKVDQGFENAQIVLADSGKLEMTADKQFLRLSLWSGEQFENLRTTSNLSLNITMPYDRETFVFKQFLIGFGGGFNMTDESVLSERPDSKNMHQITSAIDSMNSYCDSVGHEVRNEIRRAAFPASINAGTAATQKRAEKGLRGTRIDFDSIYARLSVDARQNSLARASANVQNVQSQLEWEQYNVTDTDKMIRRYEIAWHQKFVLSLSCIVFFFIGASLGSIIQKGGFGLSTTIAVLFFVLYYIMSTSGMKLGREGTIAPWFGIWFPMFVLTPVAAFLTYKGNNDSFQFNASVVGQRLRRLLGLRQTRYVPMKEVVIETPDYTADAAALQQIAAESNDYVKQSKLWRLPSYFKTFFRPEPRNAVADIAKRLEPLVDDLSNSRDAQVISWLNKMPVPYVSSHVLPIRRPWLRRAAGVLVPVGVLLWLRKWRFRVILLRDLRLLARACEGEADSIARLLQRQQR